MILKVKSVVLVDDGLVAKESWRFFEDVQGLHYTIYEDGEKLLKQSEKWAVSPDVQTLYYRDGIAPAVEPMLFAAFYSGTLGNVHLFCDSTCYLMNDAGKTIEKLI